MRGKKVDTEFLSNFIIKCVSQNKPSQEEIVELAKQEIAEIDAQIKEVERLRVVRSKLLDVVSTFEKTTTSHKEEAKILSFFRIQNPKICKFICDLVKEKTVKVDSLKDKEFAFTDIVFCIKQLLEYKVILKSGEYLLKGDMFDEYSSFVLRENQ
jgi:hypothetical protein